MRISILSGPYEGNSYNFDYDIVIGRDNSVDLPLPLDLSVSRKHLKVYISNNSVIIEDLNSTNGSFIVENGKIIKINGKKTLNRGSNYVKIGNTLMEVEV